MVAPQMTVLQQYIHSSRYARWLPEKGRRETWEETVDRYVDFFEGHIKENTKGSLDGVKQDIRDAIFNMEVMPSMRSMMTAGTALERENIAGYNCSFVAVDSPRAFDEISLYSYEWYGCWIFCGNPAYRKTSLTLPKNFTKQTVRLRCCR